MKWKRLEAWFVAIAIWVGVEERERDVGKSERGTWVSQREGEEERKKERKRYDIIRINK